MNKAPSHIWINLLLTRTTRTPAFWDNTPLPWLPILVIHIRSQVKKRQSQSGNFKKKNLWHTLWSCLIGCRNINGSNQQDEPSAPLVITNRICHVNWFTDAVVTATTRSIGTTERTRDAGQMDGRTDRWMDRRMNRGTDWVKPIYPLTTSLCRGYDNTPRMNKVKDMGSSGTEFRF